MSSTITKRLKRFVDRLAQTDARATTKSRRQFDWSIGIYLGESPFDLLSPAGLINPVITRASVSDVVASFVADPFIIRVHRQWYMFFEVLIRASGKGAIGLAVSPDGIEWEYRQIVLAEPFHLSYPYVFEWRNEYYLIPETAGSIRLYKASEFPMKWSLVTTLFSANGHRYVDASIFRFQEKWWLFTETNPALKADTLRLYYADDLMGPWLEHPKSPVIEGNAHVARPAGRVLVLNDKIIRFAQDCYPQYGYQVRAFEISGLSTTTYQEREVQDKAILTASGSGWNADGMHHVDPCLTDDRGWVAAVDGWCWLDP
jgi:hypothetical protein